MSGLPNCLDVRGRDTPVECEIYVNLKSELLLCSRGKSPASP